MVAGTVPPGGVRVPVVHLTVRRNRRAVNDGIPGEPCRVGRLSPRSPPDALNDHLAPRRNSAAVDRANRHGPACIGQCRPERNRHSVRSASAGPLANDRPDGGQLVKRKD